MEVGVAVDQDKGAAVVHVAEGVLRVGGLAGDAEPENIDGDAVIMDGKVGGVAGEGVAAVATDGKGGGNFGGALGGVGLDADDAAFVVDEAGGLPAHAQVEAWVAGGVAGEEVKEVPLGHEGDELGPRGEVREPGEPEASAADDGGEEVT